MANLGRELTQIVEIDIIRCSLEYGVSPCTAELGVTGVRKCYNCFFASGEGTGTSGCQDQPNFAQETETLRFSLNENGIPRRERIYPALSTRVITNPTKINLGGVGDRSGPLGKRARVTVSLKDFPTSDIWFDRYQSERISGVAQTDEPGYDPMDRGTFFAKLRRRYPYYIGRPLRVLEGVAGQPLSAMRRREYVISEWKGPDANGNVTITAKDALSLAEDKTALCPRPSSGTLSEVVGAEVGAQITLSPPDIGDTYSASGRGVIGSEVVDFTRVDDVVTLTGRGLDGTTADEHDEGDLLQEVFHVSGVPLYQVARDILVNFGNIPAASIPFSDWSSEGMRWLAGFDLTATITKPTGVVELIGELCEFGVFFWWDSDNGLVQMRANRPVDFDETMGAVSDSTAHIENTIAVNNLDDERLSRVLFWHGQLDPTESVNDGNNFARVAVPVDLVAEGPNEYNLPQNKQIFSRWLGRFGNTSVASSVSQRLLNRYRDTPEEFTFSYDVKDVSSVVLGAPVQVTTRLLQDDTGASRPQIMQVTSVEEVIPNHMLKATCQTYQFDGRYGFITEDGRPDYDASTDEQRRIGAYIVDGTTLQFSDGSGPYLMF